MGVFSKGEFDSLKDLNLTPEQIKQAITDKAALETKLANQQTELDKTKTDLATVNTTFSETKQRLDALEANGNRRQDPSKGNEPPPLTSFLDNEDAAFNERFNRSAAPVAQVALEAARNTARMSARMALDGQYMETAGGRIPLVKLWDKWGSEIDAAAKEVQVVALGNTQTWLNLLDYVIGKHSRELLGKTSEFVESVQSHTNARVGNEPLPEKLNDEENSAISKMAKYTGGRVTEKSYKETRDKMKFVNV